MTSLTGIVEPGDLGFQPRLLLFDPNRIVVDEAGQRFVQRIQIHVGQLRHVEPALVDHSAHCGAVERVETRCLGYGYLVAGYYFGSDEMRLRRLTDLVSAFTETPCPTANSSLSR